MRFKRNAIMRSFLLCRPELVSGSAAILVHLKISKHLVSAEWGGNILSFAKSVS